MSSSPLKFRKLADEPTKLVIDKSSPSSFSSFCHELRDTSLLYEELWEELSSSLPDILIIADKSKNIYQNVNNIKKHWESLEMNSQNLSQYKLLYNTFCNYILYDNKVTMNENDNLLSNDDDLSQQSQIDAFSLQRNSNKSSCDSKEKVIESDEVLISAILNPIFRKSQSQNINNEIPLRFNKKEDFFNFIKEKKLSKNFAKKKGIFSISIFPFLYLIILIFFLIGRNYQNYFGVFETQVRNKQLMFDLDSKINNIFLWKENIKEEPLSDIKMDITNVLNNLHNIGEIINSQKCFKPLKTIGIEDTHLSLWAADNKSLGVNFQEATAIMMEAAKSFLSLEESSLSRDDKAYLFWSLNFHNEYYLMLRNITNRSFSELESYFNHVPLNALLGIFFFFCTLITIFINFLHFCNIITLSNHVLGLYLGISQPELDAMKENIRNFISFLDENCEEEKENLISIKEKHQIMPHCSSSKRTRVGSLKRFQTSRTSEESKLYCLTGLLIVCSFLLYFAPIPLQKSSCNMSNQYLQKLSLLSEIEDTYYLICNGLKQELIAQVPLIGNNNPIQIIKENNVKLNQIIQNLTSIDMNKSNHEFSEFEMTFETLLKGDFCSVLVKEEEKGLCKSFQNEVQNQGVIFVLNQNSKNLINLTKKFENAKFDQLQSKKILREMENLQLYDFGEVYLRKSFQIILETLSESLEVLYHKTSQRIVAFEIFISITWITILFLLYFKVTLPLVKLIRKRKKLICVIPFQLLIKMEEDLTEFIMDFCDPLSS